MTEIESFGGCLCGAVRYRVTGVPTTSSVCHCRSCRLASGATPVAWVVVPIERYTLLSGRLTTHRSSLPVQRSFCAHCGTPIAYQHDDALHEIELTTATLDEPERFPPTYEIWHQDKLSWAATDPRLPHHHRDPP
ncbi:GFA family protein [Piscinibacter sp. HJYY11]|uniref:GFA family protein n=1 Tax=Piscinibacter sp. HJYY11 TaxID=2801333 RepID=UPI00191CDF94|nr:GFA family protein [Piscinibacter sp. HJYY11]MBL0729917.1 GFA family protein [Piscinibacter sp. HJYY11]